MDNIKLYYVDGISRENTPYFDSTLAQETFFDKCLVDTPANGFYVPHYQDNIEFAADNVWFARKINYLSILFGGKVYYYFIDTIDYVSEDVVSVGITLDSIQTFMFDIIIHDSIIERKFIDRWNDDDINRSYIRENLSTSDFIVVDYRVVNGDPKEWLVVGQFASDIDGNQTFGPVSHVFMNLNITPEYYAHTKPYIYTIEPYNGGTVGTTLLSGATTITKGSIKPMCTDIFIIPFIGVNNYSIDSSLVITTNYSPLKISDGDNDYVLYNVVCQTKVNNVRTGFDTAKNSAVGVAYSSNFITQMLDENYINLTFGDAQERTTYPLFMLKKPAINYVYWADMSTGVRYYNLIDNYSTRYDDNTYSTIVSNNNILHLDLKNDPWKEYIARNRATFAGALVSDVGSAISTFGSVYGAAYNYKSKSGDILSSRKSYDRRYKTPHLRKGAKRKLNDLDARMTSEGLEAIGSMSNSKVGAYIINEVNLKHSPSSVKMSGNFSEDFEGFSPYISLRIEKVIDFEQVAWYYHRFGFLVNVPYVSNYYQGHLIPFMDDLKSRYYFDYYKFQYADIDIDYNCAAEMVDDIVDRLEAGIRVWYVDRIDMCNYSYDNVERSAL